MNVPGLYNILLLIRAARRLSSRRSSDDNTPRWMRSSHSSKMPGISHPVRLLESWAARTCRRICSISLSPTRAASVMPAVALICLRPNSRFQGGFF